MAGRSAGGPETYEVQLIRALAAIDKKNEYLVYTTGPYAEQAIGVQQENFQYRQLWPTALRPLSLSATLPILMQRDGVDFYHATLTPPPFATKPLVFTVHCLSSMVHPEYYDSFTALRLNFLIRRGIQSAQRLLCVSETTRQHVNEMFGIPVEEMQITYNGVSDRFTPSPDLDLTRTRLREAGIDGPYILYLGKIQKHKNIGRLLEAYKMYRAESRAPLPLVLAGREQGTVEPIASIVARLGIAQHVTRLGYVAEELVPELYRGASVFVFPSLWEGFGIPLVESMASGTPVISSSATSLPEIVADAGIVVNPNQAEEISAALLRIESEPGLRDALIERGLRRAEQFTWSGCARATLASYESLVNRATR